VTFSLINLLDVRSLNFSPLNICLVSIALGRKVMKFTEWHLAFEKVYNIRFADFQNCYDFFKR